MKSILIYVGILAALLFALAPLISGLFVPEAGAVRQEGTAVIRYYAVSLVFLAFNVSAANLFQSISKVTAANIINIAVEYVSMCAFAAFLGFTFGLKGFWIAFPVSQAVISAVIIICFLIRRKSFGIDRQVGHALQASAGSLEEIVEFSQKLSLECRERGLDRRTSYLLPLCVEEMTKIIVQYGLKDGKEHHLETRVLFGDDIVLSIRDDCEKLDMVEMIKNWSYDTEHPENNVGIMMVRKTAKDIKYSNTMRLNNLQIIL